MEKRNPRLSVVRALNAQKDAVFSLDAVTVHSILKAADILGGVSGRIIITGAGKSGYIGRKLAATLVSLGVPSLFLHPNDAMHGDIGIVTPGDALVALSHSGTTEEVLRVVRYITHRNMPVVAIVGNSKSVLAHSATAVVAYTIRSEGSPHDLAPMASTTAALVIGDLLATALSVKRDFTKERFAQTHPDGSLGLRLSVVGDSMRTRSQIPLVSDDVTFAEAVRVINKKRTGIVGVIKPSSALRGVLTDGDVRRYLVSSKFRMDAPIHIMMTQNPVTIREDASLLEALNLMEEKHITALFVLRNRKVVGFLHLHDILERREA